MATAISAATTRDCWPAPTPTAWPSVTTAMALEVVRAQTFQARARSRHWASVGRALVTTSQAEGSTTNRSASWTSTLAPRLRNWRTSGSGDGADSSRVALRFEASWASASSS